MAETRILLIDPHFIPKCVKAPSLSLGYLAGSLEHFDIDYDVSDFVCEQKEQYQNIDAFLNAEKAFLKRIEHKLESRRYDYVGISCCYGAFNRVARLANLCKAIDTSLYVIVGGPFITSLDFLRIDTRRLFSYCRNVDCFVIGEGEDSIVELILQDVKLIPDIKGIIYKDGDRIHATQKRCLKQNINEIRQPSWSKYEMSNYGNSLYLITSRGCPYHCHFCDEPIIWNYKFRYRNAEAVVQEIMENKSQYNINRYSIEDSSFLSNPQAETICRNILENKIEIEWAALARMDELAHNVSWFDLLSSAGCKSIEIGFEVYSPVMLRTLKKDIHMENIFSIVHELRAKRISIQGSFIIGLPNESINDIKRTISFARELNLDIYRWHIYQPSLRELKSALNSSAFDSYVEYMLTQNMNIPQYLCHKLESECKFIEKHYLAQMIEYRTEPKNIPDFGFCKISKGKLFELLKDAINETPSANNSSFYDLHKY